MRDDMAMTKNVRRFLAAVRELNDRPMGVEGIALLWGEPGEGKSTTVVFACNTLDGIFLRANTCGTITSMLAALMVDLAQVVIDMAEVQTSDTDSRQAKEKAIEGLRKIRRPLDHLGIRHSSARRCANGWA